MRGLRGKSVESAFGRVSGMPITVIQSAMCVELWPAAQKRDKAAAILPLYTLSATYVWYIGSHMMDSPASLFSIIHTLRILCRE